MATTGGFPRGHRERLILEANFYFPLTSTIAADLLSIRRANVSLARLSKKLFSRLRERTSGEND